MIKENKLPDGETNFVHLIKRENRGLRCEFCDKDREDYNEQKLPVCKDHKNTMMILICPICKMNLAVHWVAGAGAIRYWCIKHHGFIANDLRKDSKFDEKGNVNEYWKKENIDKRREEAKKLNDEHYGKSMTEEHKKEKEEYMKKKEIWIKNIEQIKNQKLLLK